MRKLLVIVGLLATSASVATAQACIGGFAQNGQAAIDLGAGISEDVTTYGVTIVGNIRGPGIVSAGFSQTKIDDVDERANGGGITLGWETPGPINFCPLLGASRDAIDFTTEGAISGTRYAVWNTEASSVAFSLGLGAGKEMAGEAGWTFIPYVYGGATRRTDKASVHEELYARSTGNFVSEQEFDVPDTEATYGVFRGGITMGRAPFFFNAGAVASTEDDADPAFFLGMGVRFP